MQALHEGGAANADIARMIDIVAGLREVAHKSLGEASHWRAFDSTRAFKGGESQAEPEYRLVNYTTFGR
jgi:hypothetical protein